MFIFHPISKWKRKWDFLLISANCVCHCWLLSIIDAFISRHPFGRCTSAGSSRDTKILSLFSLGKDTTAFEEESIDEEDLSTVLPQMYSYAKYVRTVHGHDAAVPLYQELLRRNPKDKSAASRIAAFPHDTYSVSQSSSKSIQEFARILRQSDFNASSMHRLFGAPLVKEEHCTATGPIYARPVTSTYPSKDCPFTFLRQQPQYSNLDDNEKLLQQQEESKKCLAALFVLGFSLSRNALVSSIIGSNETVQLMEHLGLIRPCSIDPSLMVPCLSIFPLDIRNNNIEPKGNNETLSLFFVTDWHPTVLSTTTVGKEGAVMYIGPDSLALVANWPLVVSKALLSNFLSTDNTSTGDPTTATKTLQILDLCCGSGIQALSVVAILKSFFSVEAKATCVDINQRALQFTKFNAILNDMDHNLVETLMGDMNDWDEAIKKQTVLRPNGQKQTALFPLDRVIEFAPYNIILANPPFIPVPSTTLVHNNTDTYSGESSSKSSLSGVISKRYGLFSSGGPTGEAVLESIVRIGPYLSDPRTSVVAIVSEFMNPDSTLPERIAGWWSFHLGSANTNCRANSTDVVQPYCTSSIGNLFTNQIPLSADVYASRRAGNDGQERQWWANHLENTGIHFISPGLLFIYRLGIKQYLANSTKSRASNERQQESASSTLLELHHVLVPKSSLGSIWTPHNYEAVDFAIQKIEETIKRSIGTCTVL